MRLAIALFVACSTPAQRPTPPAKVPIDAAPDARIDAPPFIEPTPARPPEVSDFTFDWAGGRGNGAGQILAAEGTVLGAIDGPMLAIVLDRGKRDGVFDGMRAALLDETGAAITPFVKVDHLTDRNCRVSIENSERVRSIPLHFALR